MVPKNCMPLNTVGEKWMHGSCGTCEHIKYESPAPFILETDFSSVFCKVGNSFPIY
jgi:hypothetical protein